MTGEGEQGALFDLAPPAPGRATCPQCGSAGVVERYAVVVCTECGHGAAQAAAAERVAEMNANARRRAIRRNR